LRERVGRGGIQKRIIILIEEEVLREAQERAAKEGRPLGELIHDALVSYLSNKGPFQRAREEAYHLFCERPMRLRKKQLRKILAADAYE
jgi:hypothetical protein